MIIPICSKSFVICSWEKVSAKSEYFGRTVVWISSNFNGALWALQKRWNLFVLEIASNVIWTTKVLFSELRTVVANYIFLINSTCLLVGTASATIYNLDLSSRLLKLTSTLLKMKKDIPKARSILISAKTKVFSRSKTFRFYHPLETSQ